MRVFFVSLAIAVLCLLPSVAETKDWDLPSWYGMLVMVPRAGLGYMNVFFHELGHTVTFLSYGQLAIPVFNFTDGGGFAQPLGTRSVILQGLIYVMWLSLCWWFWQNELYRLLCVLAAVLALHLCFAWGTERFMLPVNFMGNGGSVLAGCFCIWRAALGLTVYEEHPAAERYINMTYGLFAVGKGLVMSWELIASDIARDVYNAGIGVNHAANDFTVIADRLETRIEGVAWFYFAFIAAACAVTAALVFFGLRERREAADGAGV